MDARLWSGVLVLSAFVCPSAWSQEAIQAQPGYEALVEQVKNGDRTVDFRQLRVAYADLESHKDTDSQKEAMIDALNDQDFKGAIENATTVLASNFVDMDAHFVLYIAHDELKETDKAEFHKFVLQSLLESIARSGDGRTPETAYEVIEVHEEYVILRFMGVDFPLSQALMHQDGHSYDAITFKDPRSGESVTLYFNIDIPTKKLEQLLQ